MKNFTGYTRDQICQLLNVSHRTLKRRVKAGEIRMVKVQGNYLYYPDAAVVPEANQAPLALMAQDIEDNGTDPGDTEATPPKPQSAPVYLLSAPKSGSRTGPAIAGTSAAPALAPETVPATVHKLALEKLAEMANAITKLSRESSEVHTQANALKLKLQLVVNENQDLFDLLSEAADREQTRREKLEQLQDTPSWRWIKKGKLRKSILSEK